MGDFNTPLSLMSVTGTEINREIMKLTEVMTQVDLIDIRSISTEHFTQTQNNIPSSQHLKEYSSKLTIYSVTKQALTDTRKLSLTCILPDYHGLKPNFNNSRKLTSLSKLSNSLLNDH